MPPSAAIGFVRVFGIRLPRASRTQVLFERNHPREPHYYIHYMGVAKRLQRQGFGTALLRRTLDRCDREGLPAYLEASSRRSAALYERLGFVPMRRPPAAASGSS